MPHENVDKRRKSHGRAQKKKVHPKPKRIRSRIHVPSRTPTSRTPTPMLRVRPTPKKTTKPDPRRRSHK